MKMAKGQKTIGRILEKAKFRPLSFLKKTKFQMLKVGFEIANHFYL